MKRTPPLKNTPLIPWDHRDSEHAIPSISTSTMSPGFSATFGSRATPTPGGRPGEDQVPGLEREDHEAEGDEPPPEDQIVGVPRKELAVQPLDDPQPAAVAEL